MLVHQSKTVLFLINPINVTITIKHQRAIYDLHFVVVFHLAQPSNVLLQCRVVTINGSLFAV